LLACAFTTTAAFVWVAIFRQNWMTGRCSLLEFSSPSIRSAQRVQHDEPDVEAGAFGEQVLLPGGARELRVVRGDDVHVGQHAIAVPAVPGHHRLEAVEDDAGAVLGREDERRPSCGREAREGAVAASDRGSHVEGAGRLEGAAVATDDRDLASDEEILDAPGDRLRLRRVERADRRRQLALDGRRERLELRGDLAREVGGVPRIVAAILEDGGRRLHGAEEPAPQRPLADDARVVGDVGGGRDGVDQEADVVLAAGALELSLARERLGEGEWVDDAARSPRAASSP
jgi:hypothetical protein